MKLDTQKPGLCALFISYKAALLKHLYFVTFPDRSAGIGSGKLWEWLEENAERLGVPKRSRASVIFALNDLVDRGFLKFKDATGKGGHHKLYSVAMTQRDFEDHHLNELIGSMHSIFEGDWWKQEALDT